MVSSGSALLLTHLCRIDAGAGRRASGEKNPEILLPMESPLIRLGGGGASVSPAPIWVEGSGPRVLSSQHLAAVLGIWPGSRSTFPVSDAGGSRAGRRKAWSSRSLPLTRSYALCAVRAGRTRYSARSRPQARRPWSRGPPHLTFPRRAAPRGARGCRAGAAAGRGRLGAHAHRGPASCARLPGLTLFSQANREGAWGGLGLSGRLLGACRLRIRRVGRQGTEGLGPW